MLRLLVSARKRAAFGLPKARADEQGFDITAAIEIVSLTARDLLYTYWRFKSPLPTHEEFRQQLPVGAQVPAGENPLEQPRDMELDRYRIFKVVFQEYQAQQARAVLGTVDPGIVTAAACRAEPAVSEKRLGGPSPPGRPLKNFQYGSFPQRNGGQTRGGATGASRGRRVRESVRWVPPAGDGKCGLQRGWSGCPGYRRSHRGSGGCQRGHQTRFHDSCGQAAAPKPPFMGQGGGPSSCWQCLHTAYADVKSAG